MKKTSIAWTNSTINLAWGCTKVSSGCKNCYMFRLSRQFGKDPETVTIMAAGKNQNLFNKKVKEAGKYIFINSMSDTFHDEIGDATREQWFNWMAEFPEKQFQILTKRPEIMKKFFETRSCPDNCWLGTSVENNQTLSRLDILREINCNIHFISFEPLLEEIPFFDPTNIQWVIVGGESDSTNPRIMKPEWADSLRYQCEIESIPFFFKQMGGKGADGAGGDVLNGRCYKEIPN